MPGRTIDGRAWAARVEDAVRRDVAKLKKDMRMAPQLDAILVGDDPASALYVRRKEEACRRVGIATKIHRLPSSTRADELAAMLQALGQDPMIHGILLQLPLPKRLEPEAFFPLIVPLKDVDGFHPTNAGRVLHGEAALAPATPLGILEILRLERVPLRGAHAVIVNHSRLVGRPLAALLLAEDATVTVCHKFTRDLASHTRTADILVTATGVPGLITRDHVKPGAVVIDVGIHRTGQGTVQGDVRFEEVLAVAKAVTPVPGGVGPMTVAMLLRNLVAATRLQRDAGGHA